MSNGGANATMILVFGILGVAIPCLGIPFGIAAWVMGNTARRELDAGFGEPSLRSQVETGRILGIIGTILWGGCCLSYIAFSLLLSVVGAFSSQGAF